MTVTDIKKIKLSKEELDAAKANANYRLSHIAALNPSGTSLQWLKSQELPVDETHAHISTVHYAAVCNTEVNLKFLIDNDIDLHDEDANKRTPLMWAIEAKKPAANIRLIL